MGLRIRESQYKIWMQMERNDTHKQITVIHVHIFVHEVKNCEPEGSEGGQG